MLDIIMVFVASLGGFCIGKWLQNRCDNKRRFVADLCKYIDSLLINVQGKQLLLDEFNQKFCNCCGEHFEKYIRTNCKPMVPKAAVEDVNDFFANVDCVGLGQLTQHLNFYKGVFDRHLGVAQSDSDKAKIYGKLGALFGAMAGILFV